MPTDPHNRPTGAKAQAVRERALAAIDVAHVARESAVTIVERGDRTYLAIYTATTDGIGPHAVLIGLAGAAALAEDMTTLLNSSPAIAALVREVLAERPSTMLCPICGYALTDHGHTAVDAACRAAYANLARNGGRR